MMTLAEKTTSLVDGRLQRSERSREAIVQALLELVREGDLLPTAERVAERARVGIRTVFRHFSDMDTLFARLHERLQDELLPLLEKPRPGDLTTRIGGLIDNRVLLFEHIAPIKRAESLLRWRSKFLQDQHSSTVLLLRNHMLDWLPELRNAPPDRLEACEMIASFEAWSRLHVEQNLSRERVASVTKLAIQTLLQPSK